MFLLRRFASRPVSSVGWLGFVPRASTLFVLGNITPTAGQRQIVTYTWMWGLGLVLMPVLTAGLSALPQSQDNQAQRPPTWCNW